MLTLFWGERGVNKKITSGFSDPQNLQGHNSQPLFITAEFTTLFLRNAEIKEATSLKINYETNK